MKQHNEFPKSLHKFEEIFNGRLAAWKTNASEFELKEDVKPILSQPYPVPNVHEENFQKGGGTFSPNMTPQRSK